MATAAPPKGLTSEQKSAKAIVSQTLSQYGLESLGTKAWQWYLGGATLEQVMLDIRNTKEYTARFPGMAALSEQGRAISEQQYIDYERQATQVMHRWGLPPGFSNQPSDFAALITGNVSVAELDRRLQLRAQIVYDMPAEDRAVLQRDFGMTPGHIIAYVTDPKKALPLLERDFLAGQIGGAAIRSGYGSDRALDERLARLGVTGDQAQQGFGALQANRDLFAALPGTTEGVLDRNVQIAATFEGKAEANRKIQRRQGERQAEFQGGGGYQGGKEGFTGVGAARGA